MYFDTHAHYDDEAFDEDRDELLASLPGRGVELIVIPGQDGENSRRVVAIAEKYPYVYAAVGWHPHEADSFGEDGPALLRALAKHEKVVAVGEIGLDYHYDYASRPVQRRVFETQLELSEELGLPAVVHDREAHGDMLDIIRRHPAARGVFHCWSGSPEMAAELLKRGWYLSFTGSVTFKNARMGLETLAITPMERIMLETDAPYLAPVPHRGKRNDSTLLPHTAAVIAGVKGLSIEEVASLTAENGKRFFGIL
jgi:TatD DNase family protein